MPSQRSVMRNPSLLRCRRSSSCMPRSVRALSSKATVGAGPLAAEAPLSSFSCMKRSLSPRCALGRRWSTMRFLTTVVPGSILPSTFCDSSKARLMTPGWMPNVQAAQPLVSRREAMASRPGSSCFMRPPLEANSNSASAQGSCLMRSMPSLVGRLRSLALVLSTSGSGGTHLPSRRVSRIASSRVTVPFRSCSSTSSRVRSIATRSSSPFSFCIWTFSPCSICST
mmetsp:Transcript_64394/g.191860  ORF Transcript_64394/g.191860 Transcript_64394/m.191860 type:complete len:226 (+) Transcript_64394:283-960(+)